MYSSTSLWKSGSWLNVLHSLPSRTRSAMLHWAMLYSMFASMASVAMSIVPSLLATSASWSDEAYSVFFRFSYSI